MSVADPSTTARWSAAMSSDRVVPQWSLRQSCLCTVKDSVLGYSRGRRNSVTGNPQGNPFLEYPIDLRHELLQHLLRLKPTGRELLKAAELLVAGGILAFDLRCLDDCKFSDMRHVMDALVTHGACLRELALAGQWLYHDEGNELARRILRACPNLRHLRLQHTTHEGGELLLALRHCPRLRRLEVLHPSTDDRDLEDLEQDVARDSGATYAGARESLTEVRLPSSVGGRGVMSLLRALPNVQYVACTYLDQVVDELEELPEEGRPYWRERCARVRGLHVSLPVCADTPELVAHWFPCLEEVSLEVQEEMDLQPLASLARLRSLELKNSPTLPISYVDEVVPLLSKCGRRLLSLSLERFDLIDLSSTAAHCPGLRSFSAQWFTILSAGSTQRQPQPRQFLDLRYLRLRPRVGRRVTPEACELLLTHGQCLEHLEFYCSYGLTDALVNKLLKTNPFARLRTLLLRHGHGLSGNGILQLTRAAQNLRVWDVGMIYSKQQTQNP